MRGDFHQLRRAARADDFFDFFLGLDRLGQPHGYLVIFDKTPSSELAWDERIRWAEEEFLGKKNDCLEL